MAKKPRHTRRKVEVKATEKAKIESKEREKPLSLVSTKMQYASYAMLSTTERFIGKLMGAYKEIFVGDSIKKKFDFYKEQGFNYFAKGKYQEAADLLLASINNENAHDIDVLYHLGISFANMDKTEEAFNHLKKAKELDGNDPDITDELVSCLVKLERYLEAIDYLEESIKSTPQKDTNYYLLGTSYEKTDRPQEAKEMYKRAIEINPRDPVYYQTLGFAYESEGRHNDAIACFKKAMEVEKHK